MLELVIFDVDGLMIDTESVWKNAFDKAGDKYGISNLGDTLFPSLIGKRLEDEQELLDRLLPSDIQDKLLNGDKSDLVHWPIKYQLNQAYMKCWTF